MRERIRKWVEEYNDELLLFGVSILMIEVFLRVFVGRGIIEF